MNRLVEELELETMYAENERAFQYAGLRPIPDVVKLRVNGTHIDYSTSEGETGRVSPRARRIVVFAVIDSLMVIASIIVGFMFANLAQAVLLNVYQPLDVVPIGQVGLMYVIAGGLTHGCFWNWGHYTRFRPVWTEYRDVVKASSYVCLASALVLFSFKLHFSRLWLGFFILSLLIFFPIGRFIGRTLMMRLGWWLKSTFVVGTGDNALMTAAALESDKALGHRVDGFISLDGESSTSAVMLGKPIVKEFLLNSILDGRTESPCIVFAFDSLSEMNEHRAMVNRYVALSSDITISPPISGLPFYSAEVVTIFKQDTVLILLQNNINNWIARMLKRGFDIVVGLFLLAILAPVMFCVSWLVRRDGHSSIFGHKRIGRAGKQFNCLKFRSMVADGDAVLEQHLKANPMAAIEWNTTRKLSNDPRVTTFGKFLRTTSLDELPQLINVLKGEMSLVGPRPIVQEEVFQYGDRFPFYSSMTPGLTGLWQTSGRSDTTYQERVLLDVWYARNWSFWHDIVILIRTAPALIARNGAI